jgi:hypothetical protein
MSANSSPSDSKKIILNLEERLVNVEQNLHYLKESGLSRDEQDIVLDKPQKPEVQRTSISMVLLIILNLICLGFLCYFVVDKEKLNEKELPNNKGKHYSEEFSLPR